MQNGITTTWENSQNILKANYYEIHDIGDSHLASLEYTHKFKNNINFLFGGKRNLQENFTESNFFEVNYDSDCLKIGLNLAKTFFQNEDLRPSNNLSLFIMLKPFGQPVSPDLSSFLN